MTSHTENPAPSGRVRTYRGLVEQLHGPGVVSDIARQLPGPSGRSERKTAYAEGVRTRMIDPVVAFDDADLSSRFCEAWLAWFANPVITRIRVEGGEKVDGRRVGGERVEAVEQIEWPPDAVAWFVEVSATGHADELLAEFLTHWAARVDLTPAGVGVFLAVANRPTLTDPVAVLEARIQGQIASGTGLIDDPNFELALTVADHLDDLTGDQSAVSSLDDRRAG